MHIPYRVVQIRPWTHCKEGKHQRDETSLGPDAIADYVQAGSEGASSWPSGDDTVQEPGDERGAVIPNQSR
jgi:hypothetical protein